jgi:hypothetical protein
MVAMTMEVQMGKTGSTAKRRAYIGALARTWAGSATQLSTVVIFSPGAAGEADSLLAK